MNLQDQDSYGKGEEHGEEYGEDYYEGDEWWGEGDGEGDGEGEHAGGQDGEHTEPYSFDLKPAFKVSERKLKVGGGRRTCP